MHNFLDYILYKDLLTCILGGVNHTNRNFCSRNKRITEQLKPTGIAREGMIQMIAG